MHQYLDLLRECRTHGTRQKNRTGIDTIMIPGGMMQYDMADGRFPILTTKKMPFGQIRGELLGFIRGYDSAAQFRELGCTIWDANANEESSTAKNAWLHNPNRSGLDDLGRIYGVQWRRWSSIGGMRAFDQLKSALNLIIDDPTSRRIVVTAWRPDELDAMALPPCHLLFQFLVSQDTRRLNCCVYQRSCDMFLGVPFNISSYALLTQLCARATGLLPGVLTMFLADVHIYENHIMQVDQQLTRIPCDLPTLRLPEGPDYFHLSPIQWLEKISYWGIVLQDYLAQPAIKGEMAI